MDIEFQEWTKLKVLRMEHMLSFENMGSTQSILLEIPDEKASGAKDEDSQIAQSLAEEMKKLKVKADEAKVPESNLTLEQRLRR